MAKQETDSEQAETQECMPCGGRGTVVSRLGGEESVVRCPWCEGSGQRRKGIDAQAHWGEQTPPAPDQDEGPAAAA